MSDGKYVDGSYWFYAPNKGAAIFFCLAFCCTGCFHIWQCLLYKCWKLTPLFLFCSLLFTTGFALRNYRILGRILYYVPHNSPIHPGRVLTTFGFISGIVEALNGWGASYSANQSLTDSEIEIGHALIKTSLLLQVVVAMLFITLAATFHRRCVVAGTTNEQLNKPLWTLYISMTLILARTIYRIVEYFNVAELRYGPGFDPATISPVVRYEWFFYVFEAALMLCNLIMFNVRHPRRYLPRNNKIYLSPDGVTEIEGPGYKDPRRLWQTLIDPFDIQGLVTGRGRETDKFWETGLGRPTDSTNTAEVKTETV
ncbi:Rtm1p [Fusarium mexicanum]|uniref:Rtm1p n=1 Tax=Fusarium mexicanum TaxID=751941 RepID=A0A8H5I9F8_9HYPO|nr:Rtm1p [Fusarium mexicanum]